MKGSKLKFTRRDFIKLSAITGAGAVVKSALPSLTDSAFAIEESMSAPLPDIKVGGLLRPPGALPEDQFRAKCISCGVCENTCHSLNYDAIGSAGLSSIRDFGTPELTKVRDFPCTLCMECPKQCPTGALQPLEKEKVNIGKAMIDLSLCFGWNGDVCISCSKACPLGEKVFDFYYSDWGNQPIVNDKCVGCGLCERYCILGGSAIKVVTNEQYEKHAKQYTKDFMEVLTIDHMKRYNMVYEKNLPKIMERGRLNEREYRKMG